MSKGVWVRVPSSVQYDKATMITNTTAVTAGEKCSQTIAFSITHEEQLNMWRKERDRLMSLSKEELVRMLIGEEWEVGMVRG